MKRIFAAALAATTLLASGAVFAQPETKLASGLDAKTRYAMWCSAVFYEEALWYDAEDAWSIYYGALGDDLGWQAWDLLDAAGLNDAEQDEIWLVYDDGAADLAERDEEGFFEILETCEADFGTLAERPEE